ncbi:MAG: site-2 protease family protein [Clostridia bacterium]|nr:site-2 protease family protein [Clostridia bacterium]
MTTLFTVLMTLLIFGILVLVHELGHYITARMFGVGVHEFSIGMGPRLFGWKGKVNPFNVRLLPIGGYVSLVGETEEEEDPELRDRSLLFKPKWQRFIVMFAGVAMNIIVAFIVMTAIVLSQPYFASTEVGEFNEGATSSDQLMINDKIIKVGSTRVYVYNDLTFAVMNEGYEPVDVVVERDGKRVTLKDVVFPTDTEQGVLFGAVDFKVYPLEKTFGETLYQAWFQATSTLKLTVRSLFDTFSGRYGIEGVSGPIGVGEQVGEAVKMGWKSVAMLFVLLSMSIGVFNLLPVPALDGGRILFLLIEAIIRRPLPKSVENAAITVSMVLVLILAAAIALKDIINLF